MIKELTKQLPFSGEVHMPVTQSTRKPELDHYAHLDSKQERLGALARDRSRGNQVLQHMCELYGDGMPSEAAYTLGAISWVTGTLMIGRPSTGKNDAPVRMYRRFDWRHMGSTYPGTTPMTSTPKRTTFTQPGLIEFASEQIISAQTSADLLLDSAHSTKQARLSEDHVNNTSYFWEENERYGKAIGNVAILFGFIAEFEKLQGRQINPVGVDQEAKLSVLKVIGEARDLRAAVPAEPGVHLLAEQFSPLSVHVQNTRDTHGDASEMGMKLTQAQISAGGRTPRLRIIA